jgi:hypothetical protein
MPIRCPTAAHLSGIGILEQHARERRKRRAVEGDKVSTAAIAHSDIETPRLALSAGALLCGTFVMLPSAAAVVTGIHVPCPLALIRAIPLVSPRGLLAVTTKPK